MTVPAALLFAGLAMSAAQQVQTAPPPVPPPLPQRTANCDRPTYATDQLVCSDAELTALDRELATLDARVDELHLPPAGQLFEDGEAWFRRRSLCAFVDEHRACAVAAYRARARILTAVLEAPSIEPHDLMCGGQRWLAAFLPATGDPTALVVVDVEASDGGVALPRPPVGAPWQPFLTFERRGQQVILRALGAEPRECSLVRAPSR